MEFRNNFIRNASAVFSFYSESANVRLLEASFENNNVYSKGLLIDLTKDIIEIPVIAKGSYESVALDMNRTGKEVKKLLYPLYSDISPQNRKTFESIFNAMMSLPNNFKLQKYITTKGDTYYGGKGILLDGNMNPLFLCTLAVRRLSKIVMGESMYSSEYIRPICRVSPEVFGDRSDKLMEKGIIKKLIPFYSNRTIYFPTGTSTVHSNAEDRVCKVIVDRLDDFFVSPIKPTVRDINNDALNSCLVDNVLDIINAI